jgi:DNA-binding GntR family transcriptional regulator
MLYWWAKTAQEARLAGSDFRDEEDWLYVRIAEDRLDRRLSEVVSEGDLMRRYGVGRTHLQKVLRQIAGEGWIVRRPGHGWVFQPLASAENYEAAYRYRALLEPQSLTLAGFRVDPAQCADLRRQQQALLDGNIFSLTRERLFRVNAEFHEVIVGWSSNSYYIEEVVRVNRLRRLLEYRLSIDRGRLPRQCHEHLQLLDILEKGDCKGAARFLQAHIGGAFKIKQDRYDAIAGGNAMRRG